MTAPKPCLKCEIAGCNRPLPPGVAAFVGLCRHHLRQTEMQMSYVDFVTLVNAERTHAAHVRGEPKEAPR